MSGYPGRRNLGVDLGYDHAAEPDEDEPTCCDSDDASGTPVAGEQNRSQPDCHPSDEHPEPGYRERHALLRSSSGAYRTTREWIAHNLSISCPPHPVAFRMSAMACAESS